MLHKDGKCTLKNAALTSLFAIIKRGSREVSDSGARPRYAQIELLNSCIDVSKRSSIGGFISSKIVNASGGNLNLKQVEKLFLTMLYKLLPR